MTKNPVSEQGWSEPESMTQLKGGAREYGVRAIVYDSSYRVEPVDILSEPDSMIEVMGWSQWIWCQSQSLW